MATLLITIDTEPDLPRRRQASPGTINNVPALLTLQEHIPNVKLTLLCTYSVLSNPASLGVLERLSTDYACEIGAHLHPEETPPFVRGVPDETSLMRLPREARAEKLNELTRVITDRFGPPVSYRAGRWMLSPDDLPLLAELGYRVDSTATPLVSWALEGGPDFTVAPPEPHRVAGDGLWEVPVTIALNRGQWLAGSRLLRCYLQLCSLELHGLPAPLKAAWNVARPIRPIWLRPTYSSVPEMSHLANDRLARSPETVLNVMLHSNELAPGGRPFIRTQADADRILDRTVSICRYITEQCGAASMTLADYGCQLSANEQSAISSQLSALKVSGHQQAES